MRKFFCASALALAISSVPAILGAQESMSGMTSPMWSPTADQQSAIGTWPADKQATYKAWPGTLQEYFWTLTPNQQTGWWALTDEQRVQVHAMMPEQRAQAWGSIEAQLAGAPLPEQVQANPVGSAAAAVATPDPMSAAEPVPPASPADPGYAAGPYKGALTAPPPEAMNKTYPVCTSKIQDSCRNRGGV